MSYQMYFGFKSEPFSNDIPAKNLLKLPCMSAVKERVEYTMQRGGVMVVTGDVGSGKSTSLRWAQSFFHPSQYLLANIIATGGSIIEFYKQLCWSLDIDIRSSSRALSLKCFKQAIKEIVTTKKQKILLIVDEAHLLRPEVFAEVHTLTQFENDSKNYLSVIFAGQTNLLDKLTYRSSLPLASRVIAKTHITSINKDQMTEYIIHHLSVAGVKKMLFEDQAVLAIHQGSGGILRLANSLAYGGLTAAAIEKNDSVTAEHIRIASTELIQNRSAYA